MMKLRIMAGGAFLTLTSVAVAQLQMTGVNLSGAEFGTAWPGTYGTDYTYPTVAEINYYVGKGMNTFRVPVRWERLQHSLNGPLDSTELGRLTSFIDAAKARGASVIVDPHNFARYYPSASNYESDPARVIGSAAVPASAFADFWSKLGGALKGDGNVLFNLMNEPNAMTTEQWVTDANAAIASIRTAGATNRILVPGNGYTGASTWTDNWYGTPNGTAMLNIVDPGNNYAFDVHQYLDSDGSGTSASIANNDPMTGVTRLQSMTQWLHAHHQQAFLGEFAVANSAIGTGAAQIGDETLTNMLTYLNANRDVWNGWTWWGGGPWWPGGPGNPSPAPYMFLLDPSNLGQAGQTDKAAMGILTGFVPEPAGSIVAAAALGAMLGRRRRLCQAC